MADLATHINVLDKICGISKFFMAPECFDKNEKITYKADIYSLGVIIYLIIAWDL